MGFQLSNGKESDEFHVGISRYVKYGLTVSSDAAVALTVIDHLEESCELRKSNRHGNLILKENPFLTADERSRLTDAGIVPLGERVREGDVLISRVVPAMGKEDIYFDRSMRASSDWDGASVIKSEVNAQGKKNAPSQAVVELELSRPLKVGDGLIIDGDELLVTEISDEFLQDDQGHEIDIAVSPQLAEQLGGGFPKVLQVSRESVMDKLRSVRAFGPRSLLSLRPYYRARYCFVRADDLAWLRENDCHTLVGEMAALRCDIVGTSHDPIIEKSKSSDFRTLVMDLDEAGESALSLYFHLGAMGVSCKMNRNDQRLEMMLSPKNDTEVLADSNGIVKKPETVNYRTFQPENDGLFCEHIFGDEGSMSRRRHWGHIELVKPVVSWLWRQGNDSAIEKATGFSKDEIEGVLAGGRLVVQRNDEFKLFESEQEVPDDQGWSVVGWCAEALEKVVRSRIKSGSCHLESSEFLFNRALPVLPPDWRPLVMLDSGNFATSDLNDFYRRIINRNNRLKKLMELNAPEVILRNETRMLQLSVDALHANAFLESPTNSETNQPLKSILELLLMDDYKLGKRLNWVASGRVIPDRDLPIDRVSIPADIFNALKLHEDDPVLISLPVKLPGFCACRPQSGEDNIRIHPDNLTQFKAELDDAHVVLIHRVMTDQARDEARRLLRERTHPRNIDSNESQQWFEVGNPDAAVELILGAIFNQTPVEFSSGTGLLIGGNGGFKFSSETSLAMQEVHSPEDERTIKMES